MSRRAIDQARISFDTSRYDKSKLSKTEIDSIGLMRIGHLILHRKNPQNPFILRLKRPLMDFFDNVTIGSSYRYNLTREIFLHMGKTGKAYWVWDEKEWLALYHNIKAKRNWASTICALAYCLCGVNLYREMPASGKALEPRSLCYQIWGASVIERSTVLLVNRLNGMGYSIGQKPSDDTRVQFQSTLCRLMLLMSEPNILKWPQRLLIDAFGAPHLRYEIRDGGGRRPYSQAIWNALYHMDIVSIPGLPSGPERRETAHRGCGPEWLSWVERYSAQRTTQKASLENERRSLFFVGRWLSRAHPEIVSPSQWDADTAAEYVQYVLQYRITLRKHPRHGQLLTALSQRSLITAIRIFFGNLIDLEWIPRRFSVQTAFRLPAKVRRQAGPRPRDMSDDRWTKLLWAGLNLEATDFPQTITALYPFAMLRAIAVLWLLGGLRQDEIRRMRAQCVDWDVSLLQADGEKVGSTICYITVPPNKYKPEFRKPVAAEVGNAIEAWLAVRPEQPHLTDRKTGRKEEMLFCIRGRLIGEKILPRVIRSLCDKAGIPTYDAKGPITTHRARATLATMLANAPQPMTAFELRDWLGHSSIKSTEWYVNQRPQRLAQRYMEADQWRRNVGRISVIIDRLAIADGRVAAGEPDKYYDVGLGFCGDNFFSRCAHRMACIKCSLFIPKDSTKGRMLEALTSNERLFEEVPLRDEERLALEGDAAAIRQLFDETRGLPAPDGTVASEDATAPADAG